MEEKKSKDSRIRILIKIAILMVLYVTVAALLSMGLDKLMRFTNSDSAITSLSSIVGCLFGTLCFLPLISDLSIDILKENTLKKLCPANSELKKVKNKSRLKEQIRRIVMKKKKNSPKLLSAKKAFKMVEQKPQLERAIEEINKSIYINKTNSYICSDEKLQKETIDSLLSAGYDLRISFLKSSSSDRGNWSNICYFDEKCSGKIYYNDEYTKIKLGYEKDENDNRD